ncbi:MAG: ABC transporter substrate-binding protein [Rhodoplanes sp.]|uniref:ABC transporter substrate-binding protein n=1 Tax=Rhodoplanes sp. TaxID=1968906 RepID=UPI00179BDCED|nr:ABC transporter substrate-binding protein [Rhodoplanes sp.]NVO12810.1 ABC transporter substrate-binding protein [Rhodoplanes sp.]
MTKSALTAAFAAMLVAFVAAPAVAETDIKFALDWKFEGPTAPYFVAIDKGYYKAEGLNVTIDTGAGSVSGIPRVAVGTHQVGFFDLNSVVRFRDQNPDKDIKVVMMLYDRPPFAIGTLKKTGITKPKDLEGRVLGAPAADGAFAQWKAFVQANGIDESKVKIENVGFPVREPMLADGKVDAITGFTFSMHFNLLQKGIPADEIKMLVMSDYGLSLYGNGIIVNPDFLKSNPEAVRGFVRATIKGLQDTVKDPKAAVKSVMKRYEIGDEKTELERLELVLREHIVTPWVKQNGVGDVDPARLAKSIEQIGVTYEYKNKAKAADVFTNQFLPPAADRKL